MDAEVAAEFEKLVALQAVLTTAVALRDSFYDRERGGIIIPDTTKVISAQRSRGEVIVKVGGLTA